MTDFIFLGSKITADSDCSHEIKRHLLLGRKAITNLYETAKETLMYRSVLCTLWERERVGRFGRMAFKHV